MKKMYMVLVLSFASFSLMASGKKITVQVKGMVCQMCSQGITKKFNAEPAVENIQVDMDKKEVRLQFKDGQDINDDKISELIKDSGVFVEKIIR